MMPKIHCRQYAGFILAFLSTSYNHAWGGGDSTSAFHSHFESGQYLWSQTPHYFPKNWSDIAADDKAFTEHLKNNQAGHFAGGVAARDWNNDYRIDIAIIEQGRVLMLEQSDSGYFQLQNTLEGPNSSLLIADIDQDGHLDLAAGEVAFVDSNQYLRNPPEFYFWRGPEWVKDDGCQPLHTRSPSRNIFGLAMGDFNLDGQLDWLTSHWTRRNLPEEPRLWIAKGGCDYQPAQNDHGILGSFSGLDHSFTSTFSDLNNNGFPDILVASDFESSQYFINNNGRHYTNATNPFIIDDQNGMGSAIADFNNDGLLDWFVTSIWDTGLGANYANEVYGSWGGLGNRLYVNKGSGQFANHSFHSGTGDGGWGWGACAADFNNDGLVDIYHTNGFLNHAFKVHPKLDGIFSGQPSRLFINQGNANFSESAAKWSLNEPNEGRSVACFDHGRDGDIDFIYTQAYGEARLFLNQLNNSPETFTHYFGVILQGLKGNLAAAGAKVYLFPETGPHQVREIRIGGNFLGQHPPEAHFGLGDSVGIKRILIQWPGHPAQYTTLEAPDINQWVVVKHPELGSDSVYQSLPKTVLTDAAQSAQ